MTSYLVPVLCFHMQVKQGFDVTDLDVHLSGITMLFTKQEKSISRLKKKATVSIWSYSRSIYQLVAGITYPSKILSFIPCQSEGSQSEGDKPVAYSVVCNGQYFTKNSKGCLGPPHFPAENRADSDRKTFHSKKLARSNFVYNNYLDMP